MSFKAVGWAVDQKAGSASAKLVLLYIAEYLNPETHLAWPSIATLADLTEQDERTVRKALKALEERSLIADTGRKVGQQKNVTVWRMPRFEAFIAGNPDKNVGVNGSGTMVPTQVSDLTSGNEQASTNNPQPLQNCQGSGNSTPTNLPPNPDKNAGATPAKMSGDPKGNPKRTPSADTRANPSGSRAAKTPEETEKAEAAARQLRSSLASQVMSELLGLAAFYDAARTDTGKVRPTGWDDLTTEARAILPAVTQRLIDRAVAMATDIPPKSTSVISQTVHDELVLELKQFRKATPAERAAA